MVFGLVSRLVSTMELDNLKYGHMSGQVVTAFARLPQWNSDRQKVAWKHLLGRQWADIFQEQGKQAGQA